ncbi:unnamed protein product, partial [Mesorhabditis belari]|uniref:[Histone H3]-dimethyl-L-lysine(36) demethylase n=1 Tax=Mesorhabditis belari TaxID=2138241 RepID=A0AAF3FC82_9BILA
MLSIDVKSETTETAASSAKCGTCGYTEEKIENDLMLACNACNKWFHASCVDFDEMTAFSTDTFHCSTCSVEHGPSTLYEIRVPHRHNYFDLGESSLPIQVGSKQWVENFAKNEHTIPPPPPKNEKRDYQVLVLNSGHELYKNFDGEREWKNILMIKDPDGLEMTIPTRDFKIEDALNVMGPLTYVDTIDVYRQASKNMRLDRFAAAWKDPKRPRLYNILSMEFSKTHLRHYFKPPHLVQELSWASLYWPNIANNGDIEREDLPQELNTPKSEPVDVSNFPPVPHIEESAKTEDDGAYKVDEEDYAKKPEVELFCLIGMAGSYTDFHIDFGGSSVYYHIFRGKKIFYVSPPTDKALALYHTYLKDYQNHEIWLGDALLKESSLFRIEVEEGYTLLIPAGWIHAVFTPVDSIVFGGNFLHRCNISMQLRINDIEEDANVEEKFTYPHFRLCNWYAAKTVAQEICDVNNEEDICPEHLYQGAIKLHGTLERWFQEEKLDLDKFAPPILKKLSKEIDRQTKLRKPKVNTNGSKKRETKKGKDKKRKSPADISLASGETKPGETMNQMNKDEKKPKIENLEPGSLKFVIRRDTIPERATTPKDDTFGTPLQVERVTEKDLMTSMFASPSTSGRQRKPSALIKDICGRSLPVIQQTGNSDDEPKIDLDLIAKQEDKEFEIENRKKKNNTKSKQQKLRGVNQAIASSDSKTKTVVKVTKPTSARNQLAKKLSKYL